MRKHKWIGMTCVKCGLMRKRKTRRILMAIVNHPPWEAYSSEQYFEYNNGGSITEKRPDCK